MLTRVMDERTVSATRFKAECLALMDEVAQTGQPLVVTKHKRPVVRVTPAVPSVSLCGSVRFLVSEADLIAPLEEPWEAQE